MKIVVSTVALLASLGLRADSVSLDSPAIPKAAVIQEVNQNGDRAVVELKSGAQPAFGDAESVEQLARGQASRAKAKVQSWIELGWPKVALAGEPSEIDEVAGSLDVHTIFNDGVTLGFNQSGRASSQPLVIHTSDLDPETLGRIQEDFTVMSRILNKTVERELGHEPHDSAMGIALSTLPGSRRPQSIYLEGYGALFFVNVNFPVAERAPGDDEKSEKQPASTWEETRRELYGQKLSRGRVWEIPGNHPATPYDADQVESLKKELLGSLKDATNIRELKPEESITLVVLGSRLGSAVTRVKRSTGRSGSNVRSFDVFAVADGSRGNARESVLILRVKKADVDGFAKGTINAEEFGKRAKISAY